MLMSTKPGAIPNANYDDEVGDGAPLPKEGIATKSVEFRGTQRLARCDPHRGILFGEHASRELDR